MQELSFCIWLLSLSVLSLTVLHVDIHVSPPPLPPSLPHLLLLLLVPGLGPVVGRPNIWAVYLFGFQIIRHYVTGHASWVCYEKY